MSIVSEIVEVKALCFEYPRTRALHDISFKIPRATVTALVGPNGAGKSTLLRCLTALETPFSGKVYVGGIDTERSPRDVHRQVGYLSDLFGLYEQLTARQCLLHASAMHGIVGAKAAKKLEELSVKLNLEPLLEKKAGTLSRGQKQRLAISQAIIHDPPLLLLDEPAAGLDPEARHALSSLIASLREQGLTIIVSSHILAELQDYSTHMLTLEQGKVLGFQSLRESSPDLPTHYECRILGHADSALNVLKARSGITVISVSGETITFSLSGSVDDAADILAQLIAAGVKPHSFSRIEASLQDVYLQQLRSREVD